MPGISKEASLLEASFPLGVFDSGVGGLTVLKALQDELPKENFIYFGDTGRTPYGSKPLDMVSRFAFEISAFLLEHKVKGIVVACNTASCAALNELAAHLPVPVYGVIEPAVNAAERPGRKIGVIGTTATIESEAYQNLLLEHDCLVWAKPCPLLAPIVEEGLWNDPISHLVVRHYLENAPSLMHGLILGCTHYPMLKSTIQRVLPSVHLVDSAETTAQAVAKSLEELKLLNDQPQNGSTSHYVTGDGQTYKHLAANFHMPIDEVHTVNVTTLMNTLKNSVFKDYVAKSTAQQHVV